jgi:hypothetical protein
MAVGYGNDFDTSLGLTKNHKVRKPLENRLTRAERVFRELLGVIANSADGAVKFIQKHSRHPHATSPIPFRGGFGFL